MKPLTIFGMLIKVCEMIYMYIKVNSFLVGRLVSETEPIKPFRLSHKLSFLTCLVTNILNLLTTRSLYLIISI
jgi:hypothetical protein